MLSEPMTMTMEVKSLKQRLDRNRPITSVTIRMLEEFCWRTPVEVWDE